jgi:predicted ester cyclase
MSLEHTVQVMDGYVDALLNRGDFARFLTPDVSWTTMETGDRISGLDAVRDFIIGFHTVVFDARPEIRRQCATDGYVVMEFEFIGTHTGDFAGVPATGTSVRLPYCVAYDVDEDGISALRGYFPIMLLRDQLAQTAGAAV